MPKSVHDDVLDAALNYVKNNATKRIACSAQPTTYSEAVTTYALADVDVEAADFTLADGTSGRKVTCAAKNNVPVDATGTMTHEAIVDGANSKLLLVTTSASKSLTQGNYVNLPAFAYTIADPT